MSAFVKLLSGWGEIAEALKWSERHTRRQYKTWPDMPIRSLSPPGCRAPRVFAYPAELRRWKDDTSLRRKR
jgi:hypothetical protein